MTKQPSFAQQFADNSKFPRMDHMPVIARMCHQIGLIDIINENIPCNSDVDPGTLLLAMVCDTLSGRSPLYKVEEFIKKQDTELLFGHAIDSEHFNDDALGRAPKNGMLKNLNKQPTYRPTGYLLMSQLSGVNLIKYEGRRYLPKNGISEQGILYLKAVGFDENIYIIPPPVSETQRIP